MNETRKQYRRRMAAYLMRFKARGFKMQTFCAVGIEPWAAPDVFLRREAWGWSGWIA